MPSKTALVALGDGIFRVSSPRRSAVTGRYVTPQPPSEGVHMQWSTTLRLWCVYVDGEVHAGFRDRSQARAHTASIGDVGRTGLEWCTPCNRGTVPYEGVCTVCGCRAGADVSVYLERRDELAKVMFELVYGKGAWEEYTYGSAPDVALINMYLDDAVEVLKMHRHLLPLDVREAMFPDDRD